MTTPNNDDILKNAKALADIVAETKLGEKILHGVEEKAGEMLKSVHEKADGFGLGGAVDALVNQAEEKVGIDLDQDGDVGK